MVMHLYERIGEGVVVRSDDVDGNTVSGVAEFDGRAYQFSVRMRDDGTVIDSDVRQVEES